MINRDYELSDPGRLPAEPRASIIVLAYRHEAYLEQAVESLASQQVDFGYEILIGEDASPDRTREVAFALQRRHPHLVRVLYSDRNRGMQGNFRFVLERCRGEILAGCEGDDFWIDHGKLARQVEAFERHPVDMAFTSGYELYPDGTRKPGWDYGPIARIVSAKEMFSGLGWVAPSASVAMRREVAINLPLWLDEAPFGDLFHQLAGSARGGAWYDPARTICYRVAQPTSFSAAHVGKTRPERIDYARTALHFIERTRRHYGVPRDVLADRINEFHWQIVRDLIGEGRAGEALRHLSSIDAGFLARGAGRRLRRALSRTNG